MRVARVRAQAKVNLFLMVFVDRDATGFHPVYTLFHRIDLADDVVVRVGGTSRSLDVGGPMLPAGGLGPVERNLAYRAAAAFVDRAGPGFSAGFAIELTKNIPVGGGLGGGSADAGAVLRGMNALADRPMPEDDLVKIAATLGSDVAFLASERTAAVGLRRGEQLANVAWTPPPSPMVLVVPSFSIATKDAYAWLDADRPADPYPDVTGFGAPRGWEELAAMPNDFEPVVESRYPALRRYRDGLAACGARLAHLAGSGSCLFGVFDEVSGARFDDIEFARAVAPFDGQLLHTRTSARVVEVEVLQ